VDVVVFSSGSSVDIITLVVVTQLYSTYQLSCTCLHFSVDIQRYFSLLIVKNPGLHSLSLILHS
jgi:hypothetical protein